jgi:hypothetical protein
LVEGQLTFHVAVIRIAFLDRAKELQHHPDVPISDGRGRGCDLLTWLWAARHGHE